MDGVDVVAAGVQKGPCAFDGWAPPIPSQELDRAAAATSGAVRGGTCRVSTMWLVQ